MEIKIGQLQFKNILSYGNKIQTFDPKGLCFITGINKHNNRRNFTGKSNLLRVYTFALFGKIEGLNKSSIINWKNEKGLETYITIQKGTDEYVIFRGIKPNVLMITKNGHQLPQQASIKDDQVFIENEILQMNYNSFMNLIYADTNNSQSILQMKKPVKRIFIENMFDLNYYTDIRNKAMIKLSSLNNKTIVNQ